MDDTSASTVQLWLLMDGWNYVGTKKKLLTLIGLHVNSTSGCVDGINSKNVLCVKSCIELNKKNKKKGANIKKSDVR